jgi:hypothetical protein
VPSSQKRRPPSKSARPVSKPTRRPASKSRSAGKAGKAAAEAARRQREAVRQRTIAAVVVALVAGLVIVVAVSRSGSPKSSTATAPTTLAANDPAAAAAACVSDQKGDPVASGGAIHVPPAKYTVDPPAGGNHDPVPAPAGFYQPGDAPSDAHVVHSQEHGYVVIWYHPDLPAAELAVLHQVFDQHAKDVLVVPRSSMAQPVAATAWLSDGSRRRLLCGHANASVLSSFVTSFANKGPEAIPH